MFSRFCNLCTSSSASLLSSAWLLRIGPKIRVTLESLYRNFWKVITLPSRPTPLSHPQDHDKQPRMMIELGEICQRESSLDCPEEGRNFLASVSSTSRDDESNFFEVRN
eukprot:gene12942-14183_t